MIFPKWTSERTAVYPNWLGGVVPPIVAAAFVEIVSLFSKVGRVIFLKSRL